MQKAGYEGSYKVDGCAVFWKADKMRLLEGESIEFNQLGLRDNVAQILVFEVKYVLLDIVYTGFCLQTSRAESRRILIGNIHVIFRPSRGDVKLGQIRYLSSRAQTLSEKWGNVPVILTGDFNSTPQSAIYKFLSSSKLNIKLHDRKNLSGQRNFHPTQVFATKREMGSPLMLMDRCLDNTWTDDEVTAATGHSNRDFVKHPLKLSSSYATVQGSERTRGFNGEPLATSFHSKFVGTVDYLCFLRLRPNSICLDR
ncbi:Carbon catabolite repressor protein 4 homolog 3 [Linum perenne]